MATWAEHMRLPPAKSTNSALSALNGERILHVILIDVHELVRSALQRLVTAFPHMHVIASLGTVPDVLTVTSTMEINAIVLGPSVPISDCFYLVKLLRERHTTAFGIVVIQQCLHPETALTLIKMGIHGLLDEAASEQDLANAITAASTGNTFLSRRAHGVLANSMSRAPIHLTERETQVLSLLKHGESNFRIAHALGLKEKTIEKYLTNIYNKLHVNSRAETILYTQQLHI
jgi:two-component system response regulator DevR